MRRAIFNAHIVKNVGEWDHLFEDDWKENGLLKTSQLIIPCEAFRTGKFEIFKYALRSGCACSDDLSGRDHPWTTAIALLTSQPSGQHIRDQRARVSDASTSEMTDLCVDLRATLIKMMSG